MRINQSKINITLGCTEYLSNFELHARDVLHSGIIIIGQTHKNEWQRQTLDCITNILVWTPQPFSLSSKQQHTHARTHPPKHMHTSASCQNIFFLTVKTNRMENLTGCMSHKQLQTYPSNMLAVVHVLFILVCLKLKPHVVHVIQATADLPVKHAGFCLCVVHFDLVSNYPELWINGL